ncbi:hypothetical protein QTN25_009649 [Entamoeba marina]
MNNQKYSTLSDKPLPPLPQNNKSIEMDIQVPPVYDIDQLMVEQSNEFKSIDSVPFKSEKRISRCSLCKNDYWLLLFILGFIFPLFWIVCLFGTCFGKTIKSRFVWPILSLIMLIVEIILLVYIIGFIIEAIECIGILKYIIQVIMFLI